MWYICAVEYYSAIKQNEIMAFAITWTDLGSVTLSEISQTEKRKYHMACLICRLQKQLIQMNLYTNQKQTHRLREEISGCRVEGWGEEIIREFGMDMDTLLYLTWRTSKDLLSSTGNSAQCHVAAWMEGSLGENGCMYTYGRALAVSA